MFRRTRSTAHPFVKFSFSIFPGRLLPSGSYHGSPTRNGLEDLWCNRRWYCGEESESNRCSTGSFAGVTLSHPWSEWSELMGMLLQKGYLDPQILSRTSSNLSASSVPLCSDSKGSNHVRAACLNFARDWDVLIRCLSYCDIDVLVRSGCPSTDRKVVTSGKRLRALVGIEERDVCASCSLRGHCERAFVKPQEGERGRTVDVIRILFTYVLDFKTGSAGSLLSQDKPLTRSIRKLLNEVLIFSARGLEMESSCNEKKSGNGLYVSPQFNDEKMKLLKPGGWTCPICNFTNFARDFKCLHCSNISDEKLRQQQKPDHLPLKRGDWICQKCNFLNFAKNTRCLQCNEKAIGRQLNPGEWECSSCGYINFKRNMACLKCDWKRPRSFVFGGSFSEAPSREGFPQFEFVHQEGHDCLRKKFFKNVSDPSRQHFTRVENFTPVNDTGFGNSARDDRHSVVIYAGSGFEVVPRTGGKSASFFCPTEKRQWEERKTIRGKWKSEESHNRETSKTIFKEEDLGQIPASFRMDLDANTDGEEMGTWFDCKNTKI